VREESISSYIDLSPFFIEPFNSCALCAGAAVLSPLPCFVYLLAFRYRSFFFTRGLWQFPLFFFFPLNSSPHFGIFGAHRGYFNFSLVRIFPYHFTGLFFFYVSKNGPFHPTFFRTVLVFVLLFVLFGFWFFFFLIAPSIGLFFSDSRTMSFFCGHPFVF